MKIKNTSTKIVHIGTTTILPDEVETVDDSLKNTPVVSMFIKRGDIKIVTEKSEGKTTEKAAGKAAGKARKGGKKAASGDPDTEDPDKDGGKEEAGEGQKDGEEDKTDGQ